MGLEYLKWWHWVLISLPLGWLLAYANSSPIDPNGMTEQQVIQFERDMMHAPIGPQPIPWVKSVRVYPIIEKGVTGLPIQIVTYQGLAPKPGGAANEFYYRANWVCARVPYRPTGQGPVLADAEDVFANEAKAAAQHLPPGIEQIYHVKPGDTLDSITASVYGSFSGAGQETIAQANQEFRYGQSVDKLAQINRLRTRNIQIPWNPAKGMTVRDWLDAAHKDYSWINYGFAWWKVPRYCNMVWIGSTFLIVGVLWPMTLSVLSGAGFGPTKADKDDYDLTRFSSEKRKAKPKSAEQLAAEAADAEAQQQKLSQLNAALTVSVSEGIDPAGTRAKQAAPAGPHGPAGKVFVPGAADPAAPVVQQVEENKEYTGEFYPVVKPKDHEHKPPEKGKSP